MEANEVRPGNYILSYLTKKWVKVDWLVIKHLEGGNRQSILTPDIPVYEPIPVTQQFLKNALFKKYMSGGGWGDSYALEREGEWVMYYDLSTFIFTNSEGKYLHKNGVKYVHQFQNWIYSHTNNELEIKKPLI